LESENEDFIESIDRGIWNAIVNGPYIPFSIVNGISIVKPYDELTKVENKRVQYTVLQRT